MKNAVLAVTLLALSVAAAGCDKASASAPPSSTAAVPAVRVVTPIARLEHAATSASGLVRSVREATLSARVSGTIARILVEVGDRVAGGQELVALDDANATASVALSRAALDAARSDLRLADLELERQRQLFEGSAAPRAQLERAQATRDSAAARAASAEASLAIAQRTLADHHVRAPFGGVVTARLRQAGESVSGTPPTALVSLVDAANLEVRLDVPEGSVDALRKGMAVTGTVSPSGLPFDATVKALGAAVDPRTRTVEVLLAIRPAKESRAALRSGALVNVQLASQDSLAGPFVPTAALRSPGADSYVWLVEDGKLARRGVQGAPHGTDLFRVVTGLTGKERVVVTDVAGLHEGAAVRAVQ